MWVSPIRRASYLKSGEPGLLEASWYSWKLSRNLICGLAYCKVALIKTAPRMFALHSTLAAIHINHLTPRVLDIDAAQAVMKMCGLQTKVVIEGPPPRKHLILLRQTGFLALEEEMAFSNGAEKGGKHRARFGEIEQRGMALTLKDRRLYDEMLALSKQAAVDRLRDSQQNRFAQSFATFPDDLDTRRREQLAYFRYDIREPAKVMSEVTNLDSLVSSGVLAFEPITYEDFLPASAAGIFQSNLHADCGTSQGVSSDQTSFEKALGCSVHDPFELYDRLEKASIAECLQKLS